MTYTLKG